MVFKTLRKTELEDIFFNVMKRIYTKPVANVVLNGKRLDALCLNSRGKGKCVCFHQSYSTQDWKV
jgi:hypothetical protein